MVALINHLLTYLLTPSAVDGMSLLRHFTLIPFFFVATGAYSHSETFSVLLMWTH